MLSICSNEKRQVSNDKLNKSFWLGVWLSKEESVRLKLGEGECGFIVDLACLEPGPHAFVMG